MAGPDPPVWGGEAEGLHRPGAPCGGEKSANCSRRHYIHRSERCQEQRERFKKRSKLLGVPRPSMVDKGTKAARLPLRQRRRFGRGVGTGHRGGGSEGGGKHGTKGGKYGTRGGRHGTGVVDTEHGVLSADRPLPPDGRSGPSRVGGGRPKASTGPERRRHKRRPSLPPTPTLLAEFASTV